MPEIRATKLATTEKDLQMIPRGCCKSFQIHGLYLTQSRRDAEGLKEDGPLGLCASASLRELIASGRRPGWVHPRFVRNETNSEEC